MCKSQNGELENRMREMLRIRAGMREWDGNGGAENQRGKAGNLGGNAKKVGIRVAMQGIKVET